MMEYSCALLTAFRSAVLNPEQHSFCIDSTRTSVELPIFVNQTRPKLMELLRVDQDAYTNETIYITYKDMKRLLRQADKELDKKSTIQSRTLKYQVKNTGIYRLTKVIDESNLEVQRGVSDTAVVSCPSASMRPLPKDKCRGELSNIQVVVDGTPPLKIKYSKRVNQGDRSEVSLTALPEDFESAFLPEQAQTALVSFNSRNRNISWARNRRVMVPVNESLEISGTWEYSIYEVQDALSNVIRYPKLQEATRSKTAKPHASSIQSFIVHDKPTVMLECSAQHPLKVAKGKSKALPVWLNPSGQKAMAHLRHEIAYAYSAQAGEDSREDENLMKLEKIMLTQGDPGPRVEKPGFYTLTSVANEYCSGEVLEPSSCLLLNPPEPELSLISESIPHQCAGNSIGLRVNLDLIGTPPFHISYRVHQEGRGSRLEHEDVDSLRTQMEFKPKYPGHYTYEFLTLSDSVYQDRSLKHKGLTVEQDIKPTAWARFANNQPDIDACIREPVSLDVHLSGEAPWTLEFDIVQGGKRRKHKIPDITDNVFTLTTPSLEKGGQHALTLTSIVDRSGCKIFLEQEAKIHVRHQRPSAAFGLVDSQRKIYTLEGRKAYLPLRLSGDPPWSVTYTAMNKSKIMSKTLRNINDVLEVDSQDTYRLEEVQDSECPGSVYMDANRFEVLWVPRPSLQVVEANTVTASADSMYIKAPVCEGDQDAMELSFTGQAPFHMEYQIHGRLDHGSHLSKPLQTEDVALHSVSVKMETKQPGLYDYKFLKLGDQSYDIASSRNLPTIQQRVHSRPSARFADAGKVYNYCKEQTDAKDVVPITFTGNPPFALELGIKHYTSTVPEVVSIPNIQLRNYYFEIPRRALSLGTHSLHIRKVRDANGCEKTMEPQESSVRVNVVDMPSISSLEPQRDYCVGDRISFALSGTPPFNVFYQFEGTDRKASSSSTTFRRIAERPGNFTITAISDRASTDSCRSRTVLTKMVHSLPSVRISKGKISEVDIHEGGEAELLFEFGGTPPFEFT